MSNIIQGIAQKKKIGSSAYKAVFMLMSACASDDGSGIWLSKKNMADDLEMSKRTVQSAIQKFIEIGLVCEVGKRKCKNGFTIEYRINLEALDVLNCTRATDAPVQEMHLTRAADAPQDVQEMHPNHPLTINEPKEKNNKKENSRFDSFWNTCPRKVGKGAAKAAFSKACKNEDPQVLIDAMAEYARSRIGEDQQYTVHPATWLNQERWGDEIPKATPIANQRGHHEQHCQNNTNSDAAIDQIARIAGVI